MLLEANPLIKLREIKEKVREIWPTKIHFSENTLARALDGELYTLKMGRDVVLERNSTRVKDLRREYAEWMVNAGASSHKIYIDETGYNMWTRRTYGRAPMGQRVNRAVGTQRGGNTTVIAAISDQVGIFYHELHFGPVNSGELRNINC